MTDERKDGEGPPPHYEGGVPILPGPADRENAERAREKAAEREYKKSQTSIQRGILATQVFLVIFGISGSAISWYQSVTAGQSAEQARRAANLASDSFEATYGEDGIAERTMRQMVNQTAAQQAAADAAKNASAIARQTLNVNASQIRSEKGVPSVVVDPWVAWYYQSASHKCEFGNVCTLLTIHNTADKTEATGLKIAVKIAIRPTAPETFPRNWKTPSPSAIRYSPLAGPGYPNCEGCSYFWAHQPLRRKAGTLYVWGVVSYYNFGSDPVQTSPFCFQATPDQIFGSGPNGFGNQDENHRCHINQTAPFPRH